MTSTVLALALILPGQAKPAARPTPSTSLARAELIAKRQLKKKAIQQENARSWAAQAKAEAAAAKAQEEFAWRILPYQLENQRQMLQYDAEVGRNAALNRMADAVSRTSRVPTGGYPYVPPVYVPPHLRRLVP